jgi:stage IV sporulation protein B
VPIALATEVHTGPAEIITVLQGDRPERYAVEISRVYQQQQPAGKGLIIKVTDERLLQKAGGIVQGMSGSPIIQDGRLVGAVTHVMVNDPTRGYGVFIEWMVRECGLWQDNIFGEGAAAS